MYIKNVKNYELEKYLLEGKVSSLSTFDGEIFDVDYYSKFLRKIYCKNGKIFRVDLASFLLEGYTVETQKSVKTGIKPSSSFSLYNLCHGKPGSKYSIKRFLEIYNQADKLAQTGKYQCELNDGYIYKGDSKQEIAFIKKLLAHNDFLRLRGQCFKIPYRYKNKKLNYYPDLFVLLNSKKIAIIEIKEVAQMVVPQNVAKYEALKKFCNDNGFLYLMCDKKFNDYEKLKKKSFSTIVENAIEDAIIDHDCFNYDDYLNLTFNEDHKKVVWFRKSIAIYIQSNNLKVKSGDLTYNIKKLKIIKFDKK